MTATSGDEQTLKLFFLSNQLAEHDLDRIERDQGIDLRRGHQAVVTTDEDYYPQLEQVHRSLAAKMAPHYEVFYALENSMRQLVADSLEAEEGGGWWACGRMPTDIKQKAEDRQQRERDLAMTLRSSEPIAYTTFGELGEIIKRNWDIFGALFASQKAVERVVSNLNSLRGPIAHCGVLAEDEIVRLRLTVSDWFRLME